MQIPNINLYGNLPPNLDLDALKTGQRVEVEIINKKGNLEGLISLGGKLINAKLEANIQTGDRFLALVKEINENGVVLSKENISAAKIKNLTAEEVTILFNRGTGFDREIVQYLTKFANLKSTSLKLFLNPENSGIMRLAKLFSGLIPEWQNISGANSSLFNYFKSLGLDHERFIYDLFKKTSNSVNDNSTSVKMELMRLLSEDGGSLSGENRLSLKNIIEEITGQQLWYQTGANRNACCLLHFPLQENGSIYNAELAIEGSRKGGKLDSEHCHIALNVETPQLGNVGVDLLICENSIRISLLNNDIIELEPLVEVLKDDTAEYFESLGFKLESISLKTFEDEPQFVKFISGKQFGGVDITG